VSIRFFWQSRGDSTSDFLLLPPGSRSTRTFVSSCFDRLRARGTHVVFLGPGLLQAHLPLVGHGKQTRQPAETSQRSLVFFDESGSSPHPATANRPTPVMHPLLSAFETFHLFRQVGWLASWLQGQGGGCTEVSVLLLGQTLFVVSPLPDLLGHPCHCICVMSVSVQERWMGKAGDERKSNMKPIPARCGTILLHFCCR